jgi:3-oxoacyl-[acyl-carrier-protein] synthase III
MGIAGDLYFAECIGLHNGLATEDAGNADLAHACSGMLFAQSITQLRQQGVVRGLPD